MRLDDTYRRFVKQQRGATVWHDPDFLACFGAPAGRWEYCSVYASAAKQDELLAVLPMYVKRRLGGLVKTVAMPPPVRYCGPLFADHVAHNAKPRLTAALLRAASSKTIQFVQAWHPAFSSLLQSTELARRSVSLQQRSTYIFDVSGTQEDLIARANKSTRRALRRSLETFTTCTGELDQPAMDMLRAPFIRQGVAPPYSEPEVLKAFKLLRTKGRAACIQIFAADKLVAAQLMLLDHMQAYTWLSGADHLAGSGRAGLRCMLASMEWATSQGVATVDTLGSDEPRLAEFRQRIGAQHLEYIQLRIQNLLANPM